MIWARRPRRIQECVVDVLLDVIHDVVDVLRRVVAKQTTPCRRLDDYVIVTDANGGLDVGVKE